MTQNSCADRCGLQAAAWSQFECGRRDPGLINLGKIASGLDLSADEVGWLVIGSDAALPKPTPAESTAALLRIRDDIDSVIGKGAPTP
jgi:transcriptional regulator with XRE-family HTH domain